MSAASDDRRGTVPAKCRTCQRPLDSPLFCSDCHTLYPAEGYDHFELLGCAPAYDLDPAELRARYLECSRAIHPDRHAAGTAEAALSLRSAARLNEAYRVLSDPVLRAEYLLELLGGPSSAQDKTVPTGVLAQTLTLREEIEEARAGGDHAGLERCRTQVRQLREQTAAVIADLARQLPGPGETTRPLRQALNAIKYYHRLLESL